MVSSPVFWQGVAVCIAGWVALTQFQQWRTSHNKLRLDLFDKRFEVIEGVRELLRELTSKAMPDREVIWKSYRYWSVSRFLFKDDVSDFIDELIKYGFKLEHAEKILKKRPSEEELEKYAKMSAIRHYQLNEFRTQFDELVIPYMKFSETGFGGFRLPWPFGK